jgi:hypothetical protein
MVPSGQSEQHGRVALATYPSIAASSIHPI